MASSTVSATESRPRLRVVLWGTCDLDKPRNRILIRALRQGGVELHECLANPWSGVADKGRVGWPGIAAGIARSLIAYPALIWRYLHLPRHDVVFVGYLGHLDVLILWPFARLRGVPLVWDAFLSLHETVVDDRGMIGARHPVAWLLNLWDWLAARAARLVLFDTQAHADWFAAKVGIAPNRLDAIFVGAEPDRFARLPPPRPRGPAEPVRILFYGQFIALHGIGTIVEAAARSDPARHHWTLIGTGQEAASIDRRLQAQPISNLERVDWVPYEQLRERIAAADVCLGIFGTSGKSARVIPNKVFQALAAGRPMVTRDSAAMRELVAPDTQGIRLVPPGDAAALLAAIDALAASGDVPPAELAERFSIDAIGRELVALLQGATRR